MRKEDELILLTCAINKNEEETRIEEILSTPVDWGYIIGQLIHHRLAFIQKKCMTPQRAVQVIKNAGGIAVLAHPNRIRGSHSYIYELIIRLKKVGLDGVELYCKDMPDEELEFYRKICEEDNLVISAGSDFHKEGNLFGCWKEEFKISTDNIEKESIINIL